MKKLILLAVAAIVGLMPAQLDAREGTMTKERQSAITPAKALQMLEEGNKRFVSGKMIKRDLKKQVKSSAIGQYPFAVVLSCLDSRTAPEQMFDQGIGDIFTARVAGNIVNEDILGSMEFGTLVAGAKLIVVVGHSACGAVKGACDDVQMGNLTALLAKIKPAVNAIPDDGKPRTSKNDAFVRNVTEKNVQLTVNEIRAKSPALKAALDKGEVGLVGALYDLETGKVTFSVD